MKLLTSIIFTASLFLGSNSIGFGQGTSNQETTSPAYKRASYSKEHIELKNSHLQFIMFRRINGWGWGELYSADGKLMAVLDHLGELMLRDQDIPMRFEAESVERINGKDGESLVFKVKSVVARDNLNGTSFDQWMHYPFSEPAITGEVTLTLAPDKPLIYLKYRLKSTGNYYAWYIR